MENQIMEEDVLRKVVKNIPLGLVVSREGLHRKVYYVNRTAHEVMGYTKDEYIKLVEAGWSGFMDIDLRRVIQENHERIRRGESFEVLAKAKTKSSAYKWLLVQVVVRLYEGAVCYVSYMDVTERIEKEDLLRRERESEQRREREALREQAARDSFTGLLNRGTMEVRIQETLCGGSSGKEYAYIALDVDDFKKINDAYGHSVGDMLILRVAELLTRTFGEESYVGRMGGDEFSVFVQDIPDRRDICARAESICLGLREEKEALGLMEEPSVSIGIAFGPEQGTSFDELYHRADKALYRIKNEQKNGIAICGI